MATLSLILNSGIHTLFVMKSNFAAYSCLVKCLDYCKADLVVLKRMESSLKGSIIRSLQRKYVQHPELSIAVWFRCNNAAYWAMHEGW